MQTDGDDGGDRTYRDDGREQAGDDDLGKSPQQFHEALDDKPQQRMRRQVARRDEGERHGEDETN